MILPAGATAATGKLLHLVIGSVIGIAADARGGTAGDVRNLSRVIARQVLIVIDPATAPESSEMETGAKIYPLESPTSPNSAQVDDTMSGGTASAVWTCRRAAEPGRTAASLLGG
ncbi:hypothetical protein GR702_03130 [Novosphingobium sp. FGD1]|uniref:Uncharacterized protein n=2 Tax=Sphingomonadaceae TaxID=41297 RepID=A0A7X4GEG7_9SPHN|nr:MULTISPECIES: hypothetical protein [Sphingomonadaceae]MBB4148672.1 hypothetical protein [Sphingobium scionense]MDR6787321.1 hypothetical protein [Sphingomonas sp. BE138]MYL96766.1 hypothetical protein [Novosphingobium silvae]